MRYNIRKSLTTLITVGVVLLPSVAFAAFVEKDLQDIMENLKKILTPIMIMLVSISYVSGIFFLLKGLLMLKAFSQPLTQASKPGEIAGPIVYLFVGAVLMYIPASTNIISNTFFGSGNKTIFSFSSGSGDGKYVVDLTKMGRASDKVLGYAPVSVEGQWATMVDTIVLYMQLIGFLAFLRGWFMIAHSGQPGVQPGSISKGIIHIVGGILAINFLPLVQAIRNTIMG